MPSFPSIFYIIQPTVQLKAQANPIGFLKDPIDLATKPRPFWTVEIASAEEDKIKKKTLIYANHFHKNLPSYEKDRLMQKLREAQSEGFRILIQWPDGLKEWEGLDLPNNYSLDFKKFNKQVLNQIAASDYQLTTNHIYHLDYPGCCRLNNYLCFKLEDFKDHMEDLVELLSTVEEDSWGLTSWDNNLISQFLKALLPKKMTFPFNKFKHLSFPQSGITATELKVIFDNFSHVEYLNIHSNDVSEALEHLQPYQLKHLKEIYLGSTTLSVKALNALIKAAPNLKIINLARCKITSPCLEYKPEVIQQLLKEGSLKPEELHINSQFKHLTDMDLSNTDLHPDIFDSLINSAPLIEKIELEESKINGALNRLKRAQLQNLHTIELEKTSIQFSELNALFEAAPSLMQLKMKHTKIEDPNFKLTHSSKLKSIDFGLSDISDVNLADLLHHFPLLENLKLTYCRNLSISNGSGRYFAQFANHPFLNLKFLSVGSMSDIDEKELENLLKITPSLEELELYKDIHFSKTLKTLVPGQLSKLKKVCIRTPKSLEGLNELIRVAPYIEELRVLNCAPNSFIHCLPNQFSHVKKLEINWEKSQGPRASDLLALFAAAPNVKTVDILVDENVSEALQKLSPECLKQLETINLKDNPISIHVLGNLIAAAPGLKTIILEASMKKILEAHVGILKDIQVKFEVGSYTAIQEAILASKLEYKQSNKPIELNDDWFDTKINKDKTHSFIEYFPGISGSQYRLTNWQPNLNSLEGPPTNFIPKDLEPTALSTANFSKDPSVNCHRGMKYVKVIKQGDPILLPSLNINEKVFDLKVVDNNGEFVDSSKIKLLYSAESHYYAVKLPDTGNYTLHFQVAVPKIKKELKDLPPDVRKIIEKYQAFTQSDQSLNKKFNSLKEFATYLKEQKNPAGACRHRAIAAYAELEPIYKNNVRIQTNDCHEFIELNIDGTWHSWDLGGYPAGLHKIPMLGKSIPIPVEEKKQEESQPVSPQHFEIKSAPLGKIVNKESNNKSSLVLTNKEVDVCDFYKKITSEYGTNNVFIAHESIDLNITGHGMTQSGTIKPNYTSFNQWLKKLGKSSGVICVDIRQFDATEIAQLNDLLDGRVENQTLPKKNIRVILIDSTQRGYYGPDFRRRVPQKIIHTAPANMNLLEEKPRELKDFIEIDLFQSPYWQNIVLGQWQMIEKGKDSFGFQWQRSSLINTLESKENKEKSILSLFGSKNTDKAIVFKNPPLKDPQFLEFMSELQGVKKISWADQTTTVPEKFKFYCTSGYDWTSLKAIASLYPYTGEEKYPPYVLSDTNILSFINDPTYLFSKETNRLKAQSSFLTQHAKEGIDIICAPGLSKSALARLLTEASRRNIPVRFITPNLSKIPTLSPLTELFKNELKEAKLFQLPVQFELSSDIHFSVQQLLTKHSKAVSFDLTALDATELIRKPIFDNDLKKELIEKGTLSLQSKLAGIASKLEAGETVILQGPISPRLYEAITSLSQGYIEGKRYAGKLIIVSSPQDENLAEAILGNSPNVSVPGMVDKINLLHSHYPEAKEYKEFIDQNKNFSYAELERQFLNLQLKKNRKPFITEGKTDEDLSLQFDQRRLHDTQAALALSPWVMIEGATGIGKTHFLQDIFPKEEKIVSDFGDWLKQKPEAGKNLVYIMDEASFMSQLSGEGENFLERFKSLKDKPPGFLWKGEYYPLTPEHKVVFAFNPASYGSGRSTTGILNEHAVSVSFERLPYFYLRSRMIMPLLKKAIPEPHTLNLELVAAPLINVYNWINERNPSETLITPREIKMMINIIASQIQAHGMNNQSLGDLASEAAYQIGLQALSDSPRLVDEFNMNFGQSKRSSILSVPLPKEYPEHQQAVYSCFDNMLQARRFLMTRDYEKKQTPITDLGLGGIVIEGGAGVGKTHFIEKLMSEYEAKGEVVYRISPSTPFNEKEIILRKAFHEGAIVIGEELNASLWPTKLLNNFLMGLDENGKPAKKPGFLLLATQNPAYFAGRSEEDPALRRRMIKLKVDHWPVYKPESKMEVDTDLATVIQELNNLKNKPKSLFSSSLTQSETKMINDLLVSHQSNQLTEKMLIIAYLNIYKENRAKSKSAAAIEKYLIALHPEINDKHNLMKNIKNTSANRLLSWIGNSAFPEYVDEIKKELVSFFTKYPFDNSIKMSTFWKETPDRIAEKNKIISQFKLLERLGSNGFELASQIFWGNTNPPKRVNEKDIREIFKSSIKYNIIYQNINKFIMPAEHKKFR